MRFSELQKAIPQATAQQLREMEADGMVNRQLFPVIPPKTEYSLTELGQSSASMIDAMSDWGIYTSNISDFLIPAQRNSPQRCDVRDMRLVM